MAPSIDFPQWITAMSLSEHLTLLLDYLSVLTWPVVILLGLFIFRVPLGELITRAESWTGPMNFGGKFAKNAALNQASAEAVEASAAPGPSGTDGAPHNGSPQADADDVHSPSPHEEPLQPTPAASQQTEPKVSAAPLRTSPDMSDSTGWVGVSADTNETALGLLVSKWSRLEHDAREISELIVMPPRFTRQGRSSTDVLAIFQALASLGEVPPRTVEIARETRILRNQAVHLYADLRADAVDDVINTIELLRRALVRARKSILSRELLAQKNRAAEEKLPEKAVN